MGLFEHKKKTPEEEAAEEVTNFFDEAFREELRGRARSYLDKIINENASLFKEDLDRTVTQVYSELKEQLSRKVDDQFAQYNNELKEAQSAALKSLDRSVQALHEQHQQLSEKLQKSIVDQEAIILNVYEENKARMITMKDALDTTQQSLESSTKALQEQQQQLSETLKKNIADQEAVALSAFEGNMAQVVEHYLLGALGDQFDLKAQLPAIIKQMEENKQAIVDDMKL